MSTRPAADPTPPDGALGPVITGLFWTYRHLFSPVLHAFGGSGCRFHPTCSEYAEIAVARFGLLRGTWLSLCRLGRCHPFAKGGLDEVPKD